MSLDISENTEVRLVKKAREQGLSPSAYVEQLMNQTDLKAGAGNGAIAELPVWHLGVTGSLRRRDIYDDDAR
jgi:hypothetical protein